MAEFDLLGALHRERVDLKSTTSNLSSCRKNSSLIVACLCSGEWGTVCDDSFSDTDAKVVCRQLDLSTSHAVSRGNAYYGSGSGTVWLDEVRCSGSESRLEYCSHSRWGNSKCFHSEDVGVDCSKLSEDPLMLFNYFILFFTFLRVQVIQVG